jgi:hypothetical protein
LKVSQEESVTKSIPFTDDTSKVVSTNKTGGDQVSISRKNGGKTRFSNATIDPSVFALRQDSAVHLYSDDNDDDQSSLSMNTNNSLKKTTISKILAPSESTISIVETDLKVTSSNSYRKVEIHSASTDKTAAVATTSKGSSHDLRLTLSKNRTKQQSNDDDDDGGTIGDELKKNGEQTTITTNKIISSNINSKKEDKQQR